MSPSIGPYDGRKARRKRCEACVKRKIKASDSALPSLPALIGYSVMAVFLAITARGEDKRV